MLIAITAALLTLPLPADGPGAKSRTVTGPVGEVRFQVMGRLSCLAIEVNVEEGDANWKDRHLDLINTKLVVEGKECDLHDAIVWLAKAVQVEGDKPFSPKVVEVTATIYPGNYVPIPRADFRLVPRKKYYSNGKTDLRVPKVAPGR